MMRRRSKKERPVRPWAKGLRINALLEVPEVRIEMLDAVENPNITVPELKNLLIHWEYQLWRKQVQKRAPATSKPVTDEMEVSMRKMRMETDFSLQKIADLHGVTAGRASVACAGFRKHSITKYGRGPLPRQGYRA